MTLPAHQDILEMARQCFPRQQIADELGCTVNQVYHVVARARRKGMDIPRTSGGMKRSENERFVRLSVRLRDELSAPAKQRNLSPHEIAARILATVIDDDLIDSVLDDLDDLAVTETPTGDTDV